MAGIPMVRASILALENSHELHTNRHRTPRVVVRAQVRSMSRKSQSRRPRQGPLKAPVPLLRRREVRIIAGVVATFALVGAAILLSDRSLWTAPERFVTIYRVHGCSCAFQWRNGLEQEGFTVVMHEIESLRAIRQRLRTPPEARGCHVAEFLGYFVEGHVDPAALRELSRRHPAALGLVTEASTKSEVGHVDIASETSGRVLLIGPNASTSVWFQPRPSKGTGGKKQEERS